MYRQVFCLWVLACILIRSNAQAPGISFRHDLSWKEIQAKAYAENKFIFMDCYTTWCLPCKKMSKDIFPKPEVGNYMNEKFISVKVQMDTTSDDPAHIKAWYRDANALAKLYQINSYPTLMFFSADGKLMYKAATSFQDPSAFIATAAIAVEPDKGYVALLQNYNDGRRDTTVLKYLALACRNIKKEEQAKIIAQEYVDSVLRANPAQVKTIYGIEYMANLLSEVDADIAYNIAKRFIDTATNLFSKERIAFVMRYTRNLTDRGFEMFVKYTQKINALMNEASYNYAVDAAKNIILQQDEEFISSLNDSTFPPDWDEMQLKLAKKYNKLIANKTIAFSKRTYYHQKNNWPQYIKSLVSYITSYPLSITPAGYNQFAWEVFEHSNDRNQLLNALEWSKRSMKQKRDKIYLEMDTYANLLYKLGRTKDAIAFESKALKLAPPELKESYKETIRKMKKGKPTWRHLN